MSQQNTKSGKKSVTKDSKTAINVLDNFGVHAKTSKTNQEAGSKRPARLEWWDKMDDQWRSWVNAGKAGQYVVKHVKGLLNQADHEGNVARDISRYDNDIAGLLKADPKGLELVERMLALDRDIWSYVETMLNSRKPRGEQTIEIEDKRSQLNKELADLVINKAPQSAIDKKAKEIAELDQ